MTYNQDFLDKLRKVMPMNFRTELHSALNKGKHEKNRIPYSTVCDTLSVYRTGIRKNHRGSNLKVDKVKVYNKAVELLAEKGIHVQ